MLPNLHGLTVQIQLYEFLINVPFSDGQESHSTDCNTYVSSQPCSQAAER